MLVLYDEEDRHLTNNLPFQDRRIYTKLHSRSDLFEKSEMQKYVREKDGSTGKWVYNHYVPYTRIMQAVDDTIMGMTRKDALNWLTGAAINGLGMKPDEALSRMTDALQNRLSYDTWVEWAVSSICDWPENIFYGPGSGDGRGSQLDVPTGDVRSPEQWKRVSAAAEVLVKVFNGNLSIG